MRRCQALQDLFHAGQAGSPSRAPAWPGQPESASIGPATRDFMPQATWLSALLRSRIVRYKPIVPFMKGVAHGLGQLRICIVNLVLVCTVYSQCVSESDDH